MNILNYCQMLELKYYCDSIISPVYKMFDRCHDHRHYREVIKSAMLATCNIDNYFPDFKEKYNNDINLSIILAAAYHDIGRIIDEDDHELASVKILSKDRELSNSFFFDNDNVNKGRVMFLAKTMIQYHRRKYHESSIGLHHIDDWKVKELCRILYDCDKSMQSDKDRVLYRYIAFYLDRIVYKKMLSTDQEIEEMVENRWKKLGEGIYMGFNPKSKTFQEMANDKNIPSIHTGPFTFTKEDILESYNRNFNFK